MEQNKWLVFANENRCKHADSLLEIKKISGGMGQQYHFYIGDVVFLSNGRYVRFKTVVPAEFANMKTHSSGVRKLQMALHTAWNW